MKCSSSQRHYRNQRYTLRAGKEQRTAPDSIREFSDLQEPNLVLSEGCEACFQRSVVDVGVGYAAVVQVPERNEAPIEFIKHVATERPLGTLLLVQRSFPAQAGASG